MRLVRGMAVMAGLIVLTGSLNGCYFLMKHKVEKKMERTSVQIAELESRVDALEAKSGGAAKGSSEAAAMYDKGMAAFYSGDYKTAREWYAGVLSRFPDDVYAGRSRYWLGEIDYAQKNYESAAREFERTAKDYPNGDKTPGAIFKAGRCYEELGRKDDAVKAYNRVINLYKYSDAAESARARLDMFQ